MKKHIILFGLLAVILIAVLLAGCGGGDETTTTTPPASTTTSPTSSTTPPTSKTTPPTETTPPVTSVPLSDILSQAENYPVVKYEMTTTVTNLEPNKVKFWIKNEKYRMEQSGTGLVLLLNLDTQTMYMYYPDKNMAMRVDYNPGEIPVAPTTYLDYHPRTVGTETVDGKECTVIEYTYEQESITTWIWNEKGFPVKSVSNVSGVTTTILWTNYDFSDIPDSVFEIPDGVQIFGDY